MADKILVIIDNRGNKVLHAFQKLLQNLKMYISTGVSRNYPNILRLASEIGESYEGTKRKINLEGRNLF